MKSMDNFSIWLIEKINRLVPTPINVKEIHKYKYSIKEYQCFEESEAKIDISDFGADWDIKGKVILDVGSGLGGKPNYYAAAGAKKVITFDISHFCASNAKGKAIENGYDNLFVFIADAVNIPLPQNFVDAIVSINVFEHVDDLLNTLLEIRRVIKPEGLIFLHFPPFYSPWGAHLDGWINFPWPHVFFRDRVLIEAARRIERRIHNNRSYIDSAQVDWDNANRLPGLNRTTIKQFNQLLDKVGFTIVSLKKLPFGRNEFRNRGVIFRLIFRLLVLLTNIPGIQEVITTKLVYILKK